MFKQRKHKTFNYQPRFSKDSSSDANGNEESEEKEFISKWRKSSGSNPQARGVMSMRTLILILVLLLICMYLLEKKYM